MDKKKGIVIAFPINIPKKPTNAKGKKENTVEYKKSHTALANEAIDSMIKNSNISSPNVSKKINNEVGSSRNINNSLVNIMTSEHLSKIIEEEGKNDEREKEFKSQLYARMFNVVYLFLTAVVIILIICFLRKYPSFRKCS